MFEKVLHDACRDEFQYRIGEAGLKPRLKRTRIAFLGYLYAEAGALMRCAQTTVVPTERINDLLTKSTMLWPLSEAPT